VIGDGNRRQRTEYFLETCFEDTVYNGDDALCMELLAGYNLQSLGDHWCSRNWKRCGNIVAFKCLFCPWLAPPCDMSLACKSKANGDNNHGSSWHGGEGRGYE